MLFSSEQVSNGHPDKICDQISDAIVTDILQHDDLSRIAAETIIKDYEITVMGEITSNYEPDYDKLFCVRGNCDTEVDQMVLNFPILADYCIIPVGDRLIYATHGHNFNLNNLPPLCSGDILLHGHTHIPAWEEFGENNLYLNPGSVSIPKENSAHGYMLFEKEEFIWKTLDGEEYHSLKI